MITQDHLILTLLVGIGFLLAACVWTAVSIPLAILVARVMHDRREADAQMAADFGEPSRWDGGVGA